ncbi:TatD family hydrolase [Rapidithrix thailandica]|uniref:TatD family hydrolase n=1 Tax=Rapidithrix thailandica TaxID=413964 RepID=A0AAW9S8I5_9BACT
MNTPLINVHTHHPEEAGLSIRNIIWPQESITPSFEFVSLGIHPWYIPKDWEMQLDRMKEHVHNLHVVAIGEAGLDKVCPTPLPLQMEVFKAQVQLAETTQKPLIIHCVKAYQEILQIKQQQTPTMPWILHGYNKKPELARQLIQKGLLLSFGKDLLFKPSVQESFRVCPEGSYFLETDDQDGLFLQDLYEKAALLRKIPMEKLAENIYLRFCKIFKRSL